MGRRERHAGSFAERLRSARLACGLTQEELADRAGISVRAVGDLERGQAVPHRKTVERICTALRLDEDARRSVMSAARADWARRRRAGSGEDEPSHLTFPELPPGVRPAPEAPPAQLPRDVLGLRGRDSELELLRLAALQAAPGLWVIDGPGGVGKTALAVHAGHRIQTQFPDGQLYIDLRGVEDERAPLAPAAVLGYFLRALGVAGGRIPTDPDELAGLFRSLLAGKRLLMVLDNAADTEQVRDLLPGASSCLVMVTSRRRLSGLAARYGAHRITLGVLDSRTAVELLTEIIGPDRTAREPGVPELLARRCGHLPLALRIAAEHAKSRMTLRELVTDLGDEAERLNLLETDETRTSVRAVFSWSNRALAPPVARMFRLLGEHPGPDFTVPSAAALAGLPGASVAKLLGDLAERHLIDHGDRPGRFRFHDLMRAYAAEQARLHDTERERRDATRRLLRWYLEAAVVTDRLIAPMRYRVGLDGVPPDARLPGIGSYREAVEWCDDESANLVAAIQLAATTSEHGLAWRLTWAIHSYLKLRCAWDTWITTHETGLASARLAGDPIGEASILGGLGLAHYYLGHFTESEDHNRRAGEIWRDLGDRRGQSTVLNATGNIRMEQKRFDAAIACFQHALVIARETGDRRGQGVILSNLAEAYCGQGRYEDAMDHARTALEINQMVANHRSTAFSLCHLARAVAATGSVAEAEEYFREAVAVSRGAGDRHVEAWAWDYLGTAMADNGRVAEAAVAWQNALALFDVLQDAQSADLRVRLAGLRGAAERVVAGPVPAASLISPTAT